MATKDFYLVTTAPCAPQRNRCRTSKLYCKRCRLGLSAGGRDCWSPLSEPQPPLAHFTGFDNRHTEIIQKGQSRGNIIASLCTLFSITHRDGIETVSRKRRRKIQCLVKFWSAALC